MKEREIGCDGKRDINVCVNMNVCRQTKLCVVHVCRSHIDHCGQPWGLWQRRVALLQLVGVPSPRVPRPVSACTLHRTHHAPEGTHILTVETHLCSTHSSLHPSLLTSCTPPSSHLPLLTPSLLTSFPPHTSHPPLLTPSHFTSYPHILLSSHLPTSHRHFMPSLLTFPVLMSLT